MMIQSKSVKRQIGVDELGEQHENHEAEASSVVDMDNLTEWIAKRPNAHVKLFLEGQSSSLTLHVVLIRCVMEMVDGHGEDGLGFSFLIHV